MSRRLAEQLIPGKPAAVKSSFGKGSLLLLGPHLEHPAYPEANRLFLRCLGLEDRSAQTRGGLEDHPSLDRAIADLKVAIVGLENRTFFVGKKLWDGSRYMELVRAIESRTWSMDVDFSEDIATSLWRGGGDLISM